MDLFLGSELAAGNAFDISYELLRSLIPGLSLPVSVGYSLGHGPAPFQLLLYFFQRAGASPKCPLTIALIVSHFP